jgi:hypothetical protein
MERLDEGRLHPKLKIPRLTRTSLVGDEHSSKELFEQPATVSEKKDAISVQWSRSNGHWSDWQVRRTRVWWELQHWRRTCRRTRSHTPSSCPRPGLSSETGNDSIVNVFETSNEWAALKLDQFEKSPVIRLFVLMIRNRVCVTVLWFWVRIRIW